ncbi:MFS transporter [Streptacidiphilus sp. P02-A3a]|uniref:MFS transporter n=1 Tax=Streptacidiphilus sp. P02-A3a TaxID=2704468 RepID=UPI0015F8E26A|nr:MFS transporter [Streptacidiphilus sp. P02-A3a]QMU72909.1 MFS transporter [Streptacidiphilus sp. P02-A3a]
MTSQPLTNDPSPSELPVTGRSIPEAAGPRLHYAWVVAAVCLLVLVGAAGFRSTPSLLMDPLNMQFGWSYGIISLAVSINMVLNGLTAPFAAALMDRFGIRPVVAAALTVMACGSGLTVFMTQAWELLLCWGVLVGIGSGAMALAFSATVTNRWFFARRGLVTGVLTAASAAGNLVFLPVLAWLINSYGWRSASLLVGGAALAVVPIVLLLLRERPADLGLLPYGATSREQVEQDEQNARKAVRTVERSAGPRALRVLRQAAGTRPFWLLAGSFAICGATTNGLVGTHFIPAAEDHGMVETTAAGLLALVGVFDVVGTVFSGWLTDRLDCRRLLGTYYLLRGVSLLFLPVLFARTVHFSMLIFIIFYGLDWVATVPPTVALCRQWFGADAPIVFGWVLCGHQVGAAVVAFLAGVVRDQLGSYNLAWYGAGGLCVVAATCALMLRARPGDLPGDGPGAAPGSAPLAVTG